MLKKKKVFRNSWTSGKEPACQCRRRKRCRFHPWVRKIPWRRKWQPTPAFLPGKSHGQRNLAGYSLQGRKELDTTEATYHAIYWKLEQMCACWGAEGTLGTHPAEGSFLMPVCAGRGASRTKAEAGMPFWRSLEPSPAIPSYLRIPF